MSYQEGSELVDQLERTPELVKRLIEGFSPEQLVAKEGDEFSILENICHLRDIEVEGYSVRIRRIVDEDNPQLTDIDGSRLAVEREYQRQDLNEAVRAFASARAENVLLLRDVSSAEQQRTGTLEGVGQITLARLLEMMCEHDEGHVDELHRMRRVADSN